jgi:uncharacterized repeat protein (TIGR02543 family)
VHPNQRAPPAVGLVQHRDALRGFPARPEIRRAGGKGPVARRRLAEIPTATRACDVRRSTSLVTTIARRYDEAFTSRATPSRIAAHSVEVDPTLKPVHRRLVHGRFAPGTTLTLVQQAAPGWKFSGWTGDCAGTGSCTVVLTQARSVTARFDAIRQLTLTVAVPAGASGQGTIGAIEGPAGTCAFGGGSACTVEVLSGTSVTLKATPAPGHRFLSGSGGPSAPSTTPDASCRSLSDEVG